MFTNDSTDLIRALSVPTSVNFAFEDRRTVDSEPNQEI